LELIAACHLKILIDQVVGINQVRLPFILSSFSQPSSLTWLTWRRWICRNFWCFLHVHWEYWTGHAM